MNLITEEMKTLTTEGWILHREWRGVMLPVKLSVDNTRGRAKVLNDVQPPKRESGYLVFAIPGGNEISEWEI